jgi:hypothetical protein
MSDEQEQARQRQHWQELAELLGLDPEPAAVSPGQVTGTKPAEAGEIRKPEEAGEPEAPPATERRPRAAVSSPESQWQPIAEAIDEAQEVEESPPPEQSAPVQLFSDSGEAEIEERGGGKKRRRGRRSSRDSKRAGRGDTADPSVNEPAEKSDDESSPEQPRERARRQRGGHRQALPTEKTDFSEVDEEETIESPLAAAEDEDDSDDELDNLSDWNVPSWNELIASLYRPDR